MLIGLRPWVKGGDVPPSGGPGFGFYQEAHAVMAELLLVVMSRLLEAFIA
jgi:hypothetical protein